MAIPAADPVVTALLVNVHLDEDEEDEEEEEEQEDDELHFVLDFFELEISERVEDDLA